MQGHGVSGGIAVGRIVAIREFADNRAETQTTPIEELRSFERAYKRVMDETIKMKERALASMGEEAADIFDAHITLLEDDVLTQPLRNQIADGASAVQAVRDSFSSVAEVLEESDDPYISERASDIRDLMDRLTRVLQNRELPDLREYSEQVIIAAREITPSMTMTLDMECISAMVMEAGGATSHTAILARSMEIPAIVGVSGLMDALGENDCGVLDGESGELLINPEDSIVREYQERQSVFKERHSYLLSLRDMESKTTDNAVIRLHANAARLADLKKVLDYRADGIGLYRSELMYIDSQEMPSEERQYRAYKKLLTEMQGKPVVVRTLDIGGDKQLAGSEVKKEENPFMGLRGIRLSLTREWEFKKQLRALLRASPYGELRIMLPMISSIGEYRRVRAMMNQCMAELDSEKIPHKKNVPLGIMVEIPSVAVMAEKFAVECDFFSIGTNDLTQYALAVDRGNRDVSHLYSHFDPGVVRLIAMTINGAKKHKIHCCVCGEAAGDPLFMPLLIGLGLKNLSLNPSALLEARDVVRSLNTDDCKSLATRALEASSKEELVDELISFKDKLISHGRHHND